MNPELLPCPLCGREAVVNGGELLHYARITCMSCGANLNVNASREGTVVRWNSRARLAMLECPICGGHAHLQMVARGNLPSEWCVVCLGCHFATGDYGTSDSAVEAWNSRSDCASQLLPCPFCKGRPKFIGDGFTIRCSGCGVEVREGSTTEAIEAWNLKSNFKLQPCIACGSDLEIRHNQDRMAYVYCPSCKYKSPVWHDVKSLIRQWHDTTRRRTDG